jgi:O-antigen ligase
VVLLLAVGLTAVRVVSRSDAPRLVTPAAVVVAATASLLATYSRSAWLGAFVGLLVAIPLVVRPAVRAIGSPRRLALAAAGAVALLAAITLPLLPALLARLDSGLAANATSNMSHLETAETAIGAYLSAPVTGVGAGGLGVLLDQCPRTSGAHSSYLTIAAELGTVGLLAAVAIIVGALRALQLRRRTSASPAAQVLIGAALAAYVGLLVANVTYDLWWDDFHWLVLGLIVGAATLASAPEVPPPPEDKQSSDVSARAQAVVATPPP